MTQPDSLRARGSSTILKAAGYVDVDAGEIVRPGVITIEGDRIVAVGGADNSGSVGGADNSGSVGGADNSGSGRR